MSNSLNPVFGEWYTDKQLGTGTDGKVFSIYREKYDGTRERAALKIIRLGENRNERKQFSSEGVFIGETEDEYYEKLIKKIKNNIDTIKINDDGKNFVRYEDIELRKASDGKGRLILLRLEEARSLSDILKEFSFTMDEAVRLAVNVCRALVKCRSFGYIYPNLKPENILFDKEGNCKLGDLGSFSCLEPSKTSIAYKRTQYYMAPEYIKTGNINCTADTYSLGLIMYMLVNRNRLPFTEPYPEIVTINSLNTSTEKRMNGEKLPRPAFASDELWHVISKACAFNTNDRYFTPDQMLSDLNSVLENKPFEPVEYDDVYSENVDCENEDVLIPDIENHSDIVEPENETPALSIKEEIQIPEVISAYRRKPATRKKVQRYEKLPEIKKVKKNETEMIKKLIITCVIAVVLIAFLILCITVRINQNSVENELTTAFVDIYSYYSVMWGGILNGC